MKKNILYISNEGDLKGGGQLSLWNLVTRLNKDKFKPFFICPVDGSFACMLRDAQISVDIVNFPRLKSLNLLAIISTILQIKRILIERKIDIVHSNGPRMNLLSAFAARSAKVPVLWHERTLVEKGMWDTDRFSFFLPDKIICNSEAIRKRFLRKANIHPKITTIINGVDTNTFNPGISGVKIRQELGVNDEESLIGMASRIDSTKGHDVFIEAAAEVSKQYPAARFLIAGGAFSERDIRFLRQLKTTARNLQLQDRIIFTGFRNDMPCILAAMDVLVLAADAEACGRVLFEAMASAKPVVATNTGGTPEIVIDNETGLLIPPKDSQTLTSALTKLLDNQSLAREMGRKGRKRVEQYFTIEEHVKKTEAVYEGILSGR